jgi:hypothetical protein
VDELLADGKGTGSHVRCELHTSSWIWTMVTVFWVFFWPSKTQLSAMISFGASTCPRCFFSTTGVTNQHQSKLEITHEHQPLYMPKNTHTYIYIDYIYILRQLKRISLAPWKNCLRVLYSKGRFASKKCFQSWRSWAPLLYTGPKKSISNKHKWLS